MLTHSVRPSGNHRLISLQQRHTTNTRRASAYHVRHRSWYEPVCSVHLTD